MTQRDLDKPRILHQSVEVDLLGLLLSSGGTGETDTIKKICNNSRLKVVPGGI